MFMFSGLHNAEVKLEASTLTNTDGGRATMEALVKS